MSITICGAAPYAAVLGSLSLTIMYVGCLYVCAGHQRRNGRRAPDRDDPSVILERFARVGVASALAPCLVLAAFLLQLCRRRQLSELLREVCDLNSLIF